MASRQRPRTRRRALEESEALANKSGANSDIFRIDNLEELGPRDILQQDVKLESGSVEAEYLPTLHNHQSKKIKTEFDSQADKSFGDLLGNNILLEEVKTEPVEQKVLINHYEEIILSDSSSDTEFEIEVERECKLEESDIFDHGFEIIDYSNFDSTEIPQLTGHPDSQSEIKLDSDIKLEHNGFADDDELEIDVVNSDDLEDKVESFVKNNDKVTTELQSISQSEYHDDYNELAVKSVELSDAFNAPVNSVNNLLSDSSDLEKEEGEIYDSDCDETPINPTVKKKTCKSIGKLKRSSFAIINEWIESSNDSDSKICQSRRQVSPAGKTSHGGPFKSEVQESHNVKTSSNFKNKDKSPNLNRKEKRSHRSKSRRSDSRTKNKRSPNLKRNRGESRSKDRKSSDSTPSHNDSRGKRGRSSCSKTSRRNSRSRNKKSSFINRRNVSKGKSRRSSSKTSRSGSSGKWKRRRSSSRTSQSGFRGRRRRSRSKTSRSGSRRRCKRSSSKTSRWNWEFKSKYKNSDFKTTHSDSKDKRSNSTTSRRRRDSKSKSRSPNLNTNRHDSRNKDESKQQLVNWGESKVTPQTDSTTSDNNYPAFSSKPSTPEPETRNLALNMSPEIVPITPRTRIFDKKQLPTFDISDDEIMIVDHISISSYSRKRRRKSSENTQIIGQRSPSSSPSSKSSTTKNEKKIGSQPKLPERKASSPQSDKSILPNLTLNHKDGLGMEVLVFDPNTDPVTYHEGKFTGVVDNRKVQVTRRDGQQVVVDVLTMNNFNAVVVNKPPFKPGSLRTGMLVLYREKDFQFGVGTIEKSSLEQFRGRSNWRYEIKPLSPVQYTITSGANDVRILNPPWLKKVHQVHPHFKRHFNVPKTSGRNAATGQ